MSYILKLTKYKDYFAIVEEGTEREVCKISKKNNTIEDILAQHPDLIIEKMFIYERLEQTEYGVKDIKTGKEYATEEEAIEDIRNE